MEISVINKLLDSYKLTEEEFLLLYLINKESDLKKLAKKLLFKNYLQEDSTTKNLFFITHKGKEALEYLLIHGNKTASNIEDELEHLAIQLKELYPKGKKEGTNYLWRCNTVEITKRLKLLIGKYHFNFTPEQAIQATKRYVSSFNGDYSRMRLLKYFIIKAEKDIDGNTNVISDMMTMIENEDQENSNKDWTTNLV